MVRCWERWVDHPPGMRKTAIAIALVLLPSIAAAQVYLPPGVGLPPRSVIGNALPQTGDAVAVSFSQLQSSLNIPALKTCSSHQWFNSLTSGGVLGCSQPSLSDISGFGTGGAAALAINVGSAGSFVVNGGALGTPASGTMTNVTGLPISTGVSGIGTGIASALATNVGSPGSLITNGGALGTPASGTATNLTGLPVSTGVSGLGTGIATALAVNVGSAGAPVVNGGALGTPSSGVATNITALNATQLTTGTMPAARLGLGQLTNSIGANVALNNTSNYFDGPSIAQGSTGTWWASGVATVSDTAGAANIDCKLWDGTTVISSARGSINTINFNVAISLSGFLATPAGNIRISCKDNASTSGVMLFNATGNSKDSTVSAFRIN
jgi:hypothetical protein